MRSASTTVFASLTISLFLMAATGQAQEASRVLGFEQYTDWTHGIANDPNATQGVSSTVVAVSGWTEMISIPLSTLGEVGDTLSMDILLPAVTQYWGEVRVIVKIPSQSEWYRELGSRSIQNLAANQFHTLTWSIPADLAVKFAAQYSDLTFTVVVNAPAGNYLLDNMVLGQTSTDTGDTDFWFDTDTGENANQLILRLPQGYSPDDLAVAVSRNLDIRDHVQILDAAGHGYGMAGTSGPYEAVIGAYAHTGTIYSGYRAWLRSSAFVHGAIMSPEPFTWQDNYQVENGFEQTPISATEMTWHFSIPTVVNPGIFLNSGQSLPDALPPGRYLQLALHPQTSITLQAGTYVFDAMQIDSDATIILDDTDGPIFVYVIGNTNSWMRGNMVPVSDDYARVLWGYLGTQGFFIERRLVGTIVAPNAKVVVRSSGVPHKGAIFARDVELDADAILQHQPFGWLIQSIDVFPEQACENEPISVHIETFNNWNLSDDMNIRINAIIGNDRIVRFPGIVGPRKIDVWVDSSSGMSEMRTEEIEIVSCEGTSA